MSDLRKINTIKQLSSILQKKNDFDKYGEILQSISFGIKEIEPLCFWNPKEYTRITIEKNASFELFLMCWEPDQQTPIHNLTSLECWIYVLDGSLIEKDYTPENRKNTTIKEQTVIRKKNVYYLNNKTEVYQITNNNRGRTVSLHLYSGEVGTINTKKEPRK